MTCSRLAASAHLPSCADCRVVWTPTWVGVGCRNIHVSHPHWGPIELSPLHWLVYIYIYIIQRRVGYPVLHTLWRLPKLSKTLPGHELLRRLFFWVELLHVTHAPHAVKVRTALDSFFDLRKLFLKALGHTMPKEFGIVLASLEVSPSTHTLESSMVDIPQSIAWHMHTLIGITCIALHFYLAA